MEDEEPVPVERSGKRPSVRVISPGLVNLGNTCFMNSIASLNSTSRADSVCTGSLQVLAASQPLHDVLSTTSGIPTPEGQLTAPFVGLMRKIYRSQNDQSLNPRELYNTFTRKFTYFKPYTQQDAQEFLRFLLEGLKSEVPPSAVADHAVRPNMKRTRRRTLVPAGTEEIGTPDSSSSNESHGTYIDQIFGGKLGSYVVCDVCKSVS
jgi:ubiquitin carboxyl-terminal hydrolase 16/45